MEKLDPKAVWLLFLRLFFREVVILIPLSLYIFFFLMTGARAGAIKLLPFLLGFWIVIFVILIIDFVWAKLFYQSFHFEIRNKNIYIERGVILKHYSSIPYERIQNIDIRRGISERILGLSSIFIQTAGYSGQKAMAEGSIPGLQPKEAEDFREELLKRVQGGGI